MWLPGAGGLVAQHDDAARAARVLRDLFDDAGPNADRVLGPGPAPGDRIIVEAAQLNAIARQFNVSWRSVSARRPGGAGMARPAAAQGRGGRGGAHRRHRAGAPDNCEIDIPGFLPPTVPTETKTAVTASQVDYDINTGRFTASLTATGEDMNPITTRISGRVEEMVEAPITVARLLPETVLRAEDVRIARVRVSQVPSEAARSLDQIVGMQLRRPVPAGQPLRLADLTRPRWCNVARPCRSSYPPSACPSPARPPRWTPARKATRYACRTSIRAPTCSPK